MANDCGDVAGGVLVLSVVAGIIGYFLGWFMCKAELLSKILAKRDGDNPREPSSGGSNG